MTDLTTTIRHRQASDAHWLERLESQAAFAGALGEFHPAEAARWRALGDQAREVMAEALAKGRDPAAACAAGEAVLAPAAAAAKSCTIHCAGHAHIDMNWMWGYPETVAVTLDSFRTVLALMDEFPGFIFSQSQASVYAIVRDHDPDMLERIRMRVREGRWEVVAAHWVEGDRNLAGGEALCRHLLYTRGLMKELFDLSPEAVPVDWSPDTFGHAATIPGIDCSGGVRYLYACRTGDPGNPPVFWWQGPDGSRLLVNREIAWYLGQPGPDLVRHLLDFRRRTGLPEWMSVYGVGDHGGGPTRRDLRRIIDMDSWPVFPRFRFTRVADYFRRLEAHGPDWPVLDRELNFEFTGCYTSQSAIKRGNRVGETVCSHADAAAALAGRLVGRPVPGMILRTAWTEVLFTHFHDILPGSGVAATRHYHQGSLQRVIAGAGQVRQQSLRAIADAIDTSGAGTGGEPSAPSGAVSRAMGAGAGRMDGELSRAAWALDGARPVVVFNPCAWPRHAVVALTAWDGDGADPRHPGDRPWTASLPDGSLIAPQRLGAADYWGHQYVDLAIPVQVPALGWTVVGLRDGAPAPGPTGSQPGAARLEIGDDGGHGHRSNNPAGSLVMANDLLTVAVDRAHGGISSLVDRETGIEFLTPGQRFGGLELVWERPVGMSAWVLGDPAGPPVDLAIEGMDIVDRGPWRASVRFRVRSGDSRFSVTYVVEAGERRLGIAIEGRWVERGTPERGVPRLQIRFPIRLGEPQARYEVPFGSVTRADGAGREVPALRWAAVDGLLSRPSGPAVSGGMALLNDGKHGHSLHPGPVLRLNLIRSSHDPDPLPEIGDHGIRLAVVPYIGRPDDGELTRWAAEHDAPMALVPTTLHQGRLPAVGGMVRCQPDGVTVCQLKAAEGGTGADRLVLRLVNTTGGPLEGVVSLDALLGRVMAARISDVLERPGAAIAVGGNRLTVALPAHGLVTVMLDMEAMPA